MRCLCSKGGGEGELTGSCVFEIACAVKLRGCSRGPTACLGSSTLRLGVRVKGSVREVGTAVHAASKQRSE